MAKHRWGSPCATEYMMTPRQLSPQLHQGRTESFDALGSHNGVWEVGGGDIKAASTGLSVVGTGSQTQIG